MSVSEDKGAGPPTGAQAEWLGTRPVSTLLHQPAAPAGTLGPRGRGVSAPGCCDKVPGLGAPNDGDIVSHEPEAAVSAARGAVGDAVSPGVSPASWGLAGTSVVLRLVDASPRSPPPSPCAVLPVCATAAGFPPLVRTADVPDQSPPPPSDLVLTG